jgi:hypothetical protein
MNRVDPFLTHTEEEIRRWAQGLRFFRFCRPSNAPHANEGDRFLAALRFSGEEELLEILESLGVQIRLLSEDHRPPLVCQAGEKRIWSIPDFPHLAQPGYQDLAGVCTHVWVRGGINRPGVVDLHISDPNKPYDVSERAFEGAKRVEALLWRHRHRVVDPPLNSQNCVCPKFFPQLWDQDF